MFQNSKSASQQRRSRKSATCVTAAVTPSTHDHAHGFGLDEFIETPLEIRDGVAVAPERPGHGLAFDWKGLERLGRR